MKEKLEKLPFYDKAVLPYHWLQSLVAGTKYHFPGKRLKIIGITGTNGKTTTSFMIWKMLNDAGHKTGLMTTVAWGVDKLHHQVEHMTTVDVNKLNQRITKIADSGAEYLVLEVTSHALAQFRVLGVPINIAVFTNLSHEHLDYHKTFTNYRNAKRKLFKKAKFGILNADDANVNYFRSDCRDYITYGVKRGQMRAESIKLSADGVSYKCDNLKIKTQIPGDFNVYNSLAAVCVGLKLGLTKSQIERGLYALTEVEGRMNRIDEGQNFDVIVDFAHTPDALQKVFDSIRGHKGKIIALHGGAGRRDESTREIRGRILGKEADMVIITEDDSRDEDPAKIAAQFIKGAENSGKKAGKDLLMELDRRKAIKLALAQAKKGDLVLILGKGHEKTIIRADGPHKFEDLKVVRECIRQSQR